MWATDVVPLETEEIHEMVNEVISQLQDIRVGEDFRKGILCFRACLSKMSQIL